MTESDPPPQKKVYRRAVTPGLRKLLYAIAVLVAILGANSVYLGAITLLGFVRGQNYETQFYLWMFLVHLGLGVVLIPPFLIFSGLHVRNAWDRKNRRAVRAGYLLLACCVGVILTGVVMTVRAVPVESLGGRVAYWLHVILPIMAVLFYVLHRLYGPRIKWRWGYAYVGALVTVAVAMMLLHSTDPRQWNIRGGGDAYFHPSEARTSTGGFIPQQALMMDSYCQKCHPDAVRDHERSVHHFSSFNNPPYLFSVRETRRVLLARDGNVQGARFCAGCHDPVPFFTGAFDDPDFDDENHPTADAGITCTVCHAITDVFSTVGNANYTIEEPLHYPFAYSENPALQWLNNQLVKAKPAFHKRTFLKPMHQSAEFCAVCHKVNLPRELNDYKEWLRGQNHYDNFLLSGVSGHGARSFYYPPKAEPNCNECHMPRKGSDDFGNIDGQIHDHRFPGSNTGIPALLGLADQVEFQADFLRDGQMRVDLFGVKKGGGIDGEVIGPLRPDLPVLEPGERYLIETVVRTLKVGHIFTQGTADSNEVWLSVTARQGDRVVGRSGALDAEGAVDPWSHFLNALVLDRFGNRIDRRNAQDIFVPLYSNQQPPGTGQVVHYALDVPAGSTEPIEITVKLCYRKFDHAYMTYVFDDLRARGKHEGPNPELPIVVMAEDTVILPVTGGASVPAATSSIPEWQRWRDYGIGLFRKGDSGSDKGELRQAEVAFRRVAELERPEGWIDLARLYQKEGRLEDARGALARAVEVGAKETWVVNWLTGLIEQQYGNYDEAIAAFEKVLATRVPERGFDFSRDWEVRGELGRTLFLRARKEPAEQRGPWLERAVQEFRGVLAEDSENLAAHYNLTLLYRQLGDRDREAEHHALHLKYKPDDNARDSVVAIYRKEHPAADHAANAIVVYDLSRQLD